MDNRPLVVAAREVLPTKSSFLVKVLACSFSMSVDAVGILSGTTPGWDK